ncbi:ABC transporter ATP-binding protein [Pigmentiphaga aceris]|uniref:ABC transporter ATP-binding protein n=1 Tax=Pigmentiphaga aceris TaxID=1940612 RepID=A0A5C0B5X6_9BURK|nr:ABC transporter ATP-binding protein [Pigmentiphaga aceris]QEI08750.1 ABC transporter ATP-binding protein [Pigmentiphaga aceris]
MSQIVLDHVSKRWSAAAGVDDICLQAESGSFVALLGPSGCGKSTTLRLIAGLEQVGSGQILIGNKDVTQLAPARRGIAMVFQSYALFPHLTVAENIVFGLSVRGVPKAERKKRLLDAATLLGLETLLDRKPAQLSGGQRQRIALGRAIVAQADVCLMDEPLSNLDAQLRQQMRSEIRALQQRLGMTMVYVTHDQTEAMTMADKVVLMRGGRIEQQGTPAELYERPATLFAAAFIGAPAMNLFASGQAGAQQGVTLGVRPEHLRVVAPGTGLSAASSAASLSAGLSARVEAVEYLGAESMLVCSHNGARIVVRQAGRTTVSAGDNIGLAWQPGDEHRFDSAAGHRIDVPLAA